MRLEGDRAGSEALSVWLTPIFVSAAAVIIVRRKRFIRRFRERGVFVPVHNDVYYMNEQAAGYFLAAQRRRALVFMAILHVVFVIVLFTSVRW